MNRRELLKFFGVGTVIAPVASGGISARLLAEPDIVLAAEFPNGHKPRHFADRLKWNPFEALWLRFWQIENNPPSCVNYGLGTLEHILQREPNEDEKAAVAGVIQWFGTNCGHCFLEETLRASGYRLIHDRDLPSVREIEAIQNSSIFDKGPLEVTIHRHGRPIVLRSREMPL